PAGQVGGATQPRPADQATQQPDAAQRIKEQFHRDSFEGGSTRAQAAKFLNPQLANPAQSVAQAQRAAEAQKPQNATQTQQATEAQRAAETQKPQDATKAQQVTQAQKAAEAQKPQDATK